MKRTCCRSLKIKRIVNDINGLIILDKPKGHTSNDCISLIKKILHPRKIGHTGTLDENATGVLVCLLGSATKSQEYLMKTGAKIYDAELILGISTDTEDITGKILEYKEYVNDIFDINKLNVVVKTFIGDYDQIPPMYSAKKVGGKKLINLARKGIVVERKVSKVKINSIEVYSCDDYLFENYSLKKINIRVSCSKGTYIRTLCKDIGEKMGIPSCMGNLRRIATGEFGIENSITINDIMSKVEANDYSFIKPCYYQKDDSVITFGKFETLHLGHQCIISRVVNDAKAKGIKSTVLIIGSNEDSKIISKEQRISKLKLIGVDNIFNFELNDRNMKISPENFVEDILIKQLKAREVVVGSDCKFGYKGKGDGALLTSLCKKYDINVIIIDKLKVENSDTYISSTFIKSEFDKGNVELVNKLLGKG